MSDPTVAAPAPTPDPTLGVYNEQAQAAVAPTIEENEQAELERLYAKLKPEAVEEARKYVIVRTPTKYVTEMQELIDADFAPPVVEDPPAA